MMLLKDSTDTVPESVDGNPLSTAKMNVSRLENHFSQAWKAPTRTPNPARRASLESLTYQGQCHAGAGTARQLARQHKKLGANLPKLE